MRFQTTKDGYFIKVKDKDELPWIAVLENVTYMLRARTWFIPNTELNHRMLVKKGFIKEIPKLAIRQLPSELKSRLPNSLYDIQLDALDFLYTTNGNGIVRLRTGGGKTATSLLYTTLDDTIRTTLVICQANLKTQWKYQIKEWVKSNDVHIVYGRKSYKFDNYRFIIINYELLQYHASELRELAPDCLIIDEVQFFQSNEAKRTQALFEIAEVVEHVIALSATPITKNPYQFYPILHILCPEHVDTFEKFVFTYCNRKPNKYGGFTYTGVNNLGQLRAILQNIMISRMKSNDIPEGRVIPIIFPTEGDVRTMYNQAEEDFIRVFEKSPKKQQKAELVYLQYLTYLAKRDYVIAWVKDFIKENKLMLYMNHRKILEDLHKEFPNDSVKYYGGMSNKQKEEAKAEFMQNKNLFLCTSAGTTGLDGMQHVCWNIGYVQFPYVPTLFDQFNGRIERFGQQNTPNIFAFISENTIDERIIAILDKNRKIVEQVTDGKSLSDINLLGELIESYKSIIR